MMVVPGKVDLKPFSRMGFKGRFVRGIASRAQIADVSHFLERVVCYLILISALIVPWNVLLAQSQSRRAFDHIAS